MSAGRVSIMDRGEAARIARRYQEGAVSPTLKLYWRKVADRLEAAQEGARA